MHDLRTQVYRHLQRLSLAFFTRTRTGEIQSRIANDIGGVQSVVTSHRRVDRRQRDDGGGVGRRHVPAGLAARAVLARAAAVLRRCSRAASATSGARSRRSSRARWPTSPRSSRSRCRVSGILLGKTMGRGAELADRFDKESENLADLEVRSRMAGRWMMSAIQTSFAVMPALVYLFAGLAPGAASIGTIVAFTTLQTRLFFPVQSLLSVAVDIQTSHRAVRARLRVPGPARRHRARHEVAGRRPRRGPLRRRLVPLRRRVDAAGRRHHRPRRHAHRAGRRDRGGQDVARLPRRAPLRPRAGRA